MVARPLTETLDDARRGTVPAGDRVVAASAVRLLSGRFEAQFEDVDAATAAARDARNVGFVVDVQQDTTGWLTVARRQLPFPDDERDRYASRFHAIATRHDGAFNRFVEEPPAPPAETN